MASVMAFTRAAPARTLASRRALLALTRLHPPTTLPGVFSRTAHTAFASGRSLTHATLPRRGVVAAASSSTPLADAPAAATALAADVAVPISRRLAARNGLKDVRALLNTAVEDTVWPARVDAAIGALGDETGKARVLVYGDARSAVSDLVTALLEDPLSSDEHRRAVLFNRHDTGGREGLWEVSFGQQTRVTSPSELELPVPWLQESHASLVELVESASHTFISVSNNFHSATHLLLLTDSLRLLSPPTLRSLVRAFASKPNTHLLVDTTPAPNVTPESVQAQLDREFDRLLDPHSPRPQVHFVAPPRGVRAINELREAFGHAEPSPTAVETFQSEFIASRISSLRSRVLPPSLSQPQERLAAALSARVNAALFTARSALNACASACASAATDADKLRSRLNAFNAHGESDAAALARSVVGPEGAEATVQAALADGRKVVESRFRRLAWWKLPWRVDDIAAEAEAAVLRGFGADLERKLTYDAGRLVSLRNDLHERTRELLGALSGTPFHSAVLLNTLARQESLTPTPTHTNLTLAIVERRAQLTAAGGPTDALQLAAQRVLLSSYVLAGSSGATAYLAFMTGYADGAVAAGAASLLGVWAVRRVQRGWERARRKFWTDWDRAARGLGWDLKDAVDRSVSDAVLAQPRTARDGLEEIVGRRQDEIRRNMAEVERISEKLRVIEGAS